MAVAKSDGDELLVATLDLDDVAQAQKSLPRVAPPGPLRPARPGLSALTSDVRQAARADRADTYGSATRRRAQLFASRVTRS
jgi:hypothetical protein